MLRKWLKPREAVDAGIALADRFPRQSMSVSATAGQPARNYLRRAAHEIRSLGLNFYKRAWFANSFKWRLLENGVDAETANEWTQTLVLEVSSKKTSAAPSHEASVAQTNRAGIKKARSLSLLVDDSYAQGAYAETVTHLQDLAVLKPRDAAVLNRLGAALSKVGRYPEAEDYFRKAIGRQPDHPEAHGNLGAVCLARGRFAEAENPLRLALKLKRADVVH